MINLFSDPEDDRLRKIEVERIRGIVVRALGEKSDLYQIKVMELDHCPDPACEKIETLIILLGDEKTRLPFCSPERNPPPAEHSPQKKEGTRLQFCSPERTLFPAEHIPQKKEGTRLQFRFTCRLADLTEEKMSGFLADLQKL
jgi:hypothetical protein